MKVYSNSWVGFDLDGTLAEYGEWKGPAVIGKPIPIMIEKVKRLLKDGIQVKILTARVSRNRFSSTDDEHIVAEKAIRKWTREHIGKELEITCSKDYAMLWFYDDRAVQVEKDTGKILGKDFEL